MCLAGGACGISWWGCGCAMGLNLTSTLKLTVQVSQLAHTTSQAVISGYIEDALTREPAPEPLHFTMYMWVSILVLCLTLWILGRFIRILGKKNTALKTIVPELKSNGRSEPPIPSAADQSKPHQYDVFINHRGPDVKRTFVSHLNAALQRDGFRPFLDAKDIGKGRHVFTSIDKALKGACVHVAVFSKRYAESKYCLNELCDMLRSGGIILPVFYGVNAEDLRWVEQGPFKRGFEKHVKRGRGEDVRKWKEALRKVADYRGFRLDEVNGDEDQLIRSILVEVRSAIPPALLPGKQPYGMEVRLKEVLKTLDGVSVLGLVGMGGIGKTTLATAIYNHFLSRQQFERYCFLNDVRSSDPSQLQQTLMRDLGYNSDITPQGYRHAVDAFISQRVLVIVDDIDHKSQLETLIPDIQKLGPSTRLVITSRQHDVLKQAIASAPCWEVYQVPLLNRYDSWHLFNRHAFLSGTPSEGFADLAAKVADACGGHALSLETVGASLFDKKNPEDREIWLEAVKALEENEDIFSKLRSTYDRLPSGGDRAMFRDIACLLIGMNKEMALTIWKSCNNCTCNMTKTPALVLRRLVDRSLVIIDHEGMLRMHDALRDMGREIVQDEARRLEKRTHLWEASKAVKVLSYEMKNTITRGLCFAVGKRSTDPDFSVWANMQGHVGSCEALLLANMKELHLLVLDNCHVVVPDDFSSWPQELRWLQWRWFCFAQLPSQLKLPFLVVLDLSASGKLTRLWEDDADIELPLLQTLILTQCRGLEELAENLGQSMPKLKRLVMDNCESLKKLPESLGHLTNLEHMDLSWCKELVALPDAVVELVSLKTLTLYFCRKLQHLPEELGRLTNLEILDLRICSSLFALPASLGGLKRLKMLHEEGTKVKDIPTEFGFLTSLTSLSMNSIQTVPNTFQGLEALTSLRLHAASADMSALRAFSALKNLDLSRHATITTLPKSFGNLSLLVHLNMWRCKALLTIEALPESLERLELGECYKLSEIPSLARMESLLYLDLHDCRSLRYVHGLERLTMLEHADVSGCTSVDGRGICMMRSSALRECYMSGSKIGVMYNSRWLEGEPPEQVINCFGNRLPLLSNGMTHHVVVPHFNWAPVFNATISSEARCTTLIWCLVVEKFECGNCVRVKVEVLRGGRVVMEYTSYPSGRSCDGNQVWLWTWRREHQVVQSLQHGSEIRVYVQWVGTQRESTVLEGGLCVVHSEGKSFTLVRNAEVLDKNQSEDLARQFGELVLEDENDHQSVDALGRC